MAVSPLHEKLESGETALGLYVNSPDMVELCGHLGFDWFLVDQMWTAHDWSATDALIRAGEAAGCEVIRNRPPMSFSEDFAHFAAAVPGCFLLLGNGEDAPNGQPRQSADYDFNDALLPIGAEFWMQLVRDRLPAGKD